MPTVRLGNTAALHQGQVLEGNRVTTVPFVDEDDLAMRVRTLTHSDGLWPRVSAAAPAWVTCDDPDLELAIAAHFSCPIGEPKNWA